MISDLKNIGEVKNIICKKMCFEALLEFYFSPGAYRRMTTELFIIFIHCLELCIKNCIDTISASVHISYPDKRTQS